MRLRKFNESIKKNISEKELVQEISTIANDFTDNGYELTYQRDEEHKTLFHVEISTPLTDHRYLNLYSHKDLKDIIQMSKDKDKYVPTFQNNIEEFYDRIQSLEDSYHVSIAQISANVSTCDIVIEMWLGEAQYQ